LFEQLLVAVSGRLRYEVDIPYGTKVHGGEGRRAGEALG
jgi:hypothetical protein